MHKLWCIEGDLIAMLVEGEVNLNLKLDARVPAIRLVRYYYIIIILVISIPEKCLPGEQ